MGALFLASGRQYDRERAMEPRAEAVSREHSGRKVGQEEMETESRVVSALRLL